MRFGQKKRGEALEELRAAHNVPTWKRARSDARPSRLSRAFTSMWALGFLGAGVCALVAVIVIGWVVRGAAGTGAGLAVVAEIPLQVFGVLPMPGGIAYVVLAYTETLLLACAMVGGVGGIVVRRLTRRRRTEAVDRGLKSLIGQLDRGPWTGLATDEQPGIPSGWTATNAAGQRVKVFLNSDGRVEVWLNPGPGMTRAIAEYGEPIPSRSVVSINRRLFVSGSRSRAE